MGYQQKKKKKKKKKNFKINFLWIKTRGDAFKYTSKKSFGR